MDTTQLQNLQRSSNQDSVILAREQTNRSVEWNRSSRNRFTQIQTFDFWQRNKNNSKEHGCSSPNSAETIGHSHAKQFIYTMSLLFSQKLTQNGKQQKTQNCKTPRR